MKIQKITRTLLAMAALAAASGLALAAPASDVPFHGDQIYPESVSYSAAQGRFFVGSVKHGTVGTVAPDGTYTPFITDPRLISTLGLHVDDQRNTLWVTNSDPGAGDRTAEATRGHLAAVAAYDATTGAPKGYYDLSSLDPGAHLANDVALDDHGTVYVTDSFSPEIYRIDPSGAMSILVSNEAFGRGEGFNLNGIAWLPGGYLLVGNWNTGKLFRVDLRHPAKLVSVKLDAPLKGADGFLLLDSRHLVIAQNAGMDRVIELTSTDGWRSATLTREVKSRLSMPTAAVVRDGHVMVLDSRIDTLLDPHAPKVDDFLLEPF